MYIYIYNLCRCHEVVRFDFLFNYIEIKMSFPKKKTTI
jgi:hypothetical protein